MTEEEKQTLMVFMTAFCKMSERDKGYILGLGDGMAMQLELPAKNRQEETHEQVVGGGAQEINKN